MSQNVTPVSNENNAALENSRGNSACAKTTAYREVTKLSVPLTLTPILTTWPYSRFKSVLLANEIIVMRKEISAETSIFSNAWSQIKQVCVIFIHLKLR